jgi:hypothetical protein
MKIRPVEAELFHEYRSFSQFANAPKNHGIQEAQNTANPFPTSKRDCSDHKTIKKVKPHSLTVVRQMFLSHWTSWRSNKTSMLTNSGISFFFFFKSM